MLQQLWEDPWKLNTAHDPAIPRLSIHSRTVKILIYAKMRTKAFTGAIVEALFWGLKNKYFFHPRHQQTKEIVLPKSHLMSCCVVQATWVHLHHQRKYSLYSQQLLPTSMSLGGRTLVPHMFSCEILLPLHDRTWLDPILSESLEGTDMAKSSSE